MSRQSLMLIGGPDSGKTNYVGRLWHALRNGAGKLTAPSGLTEIKYVEDALAHLLKGSFAPRSDQNLDEGRRDFVVPVLLADSSETEPIEIVVPDVSGELWKIAVESSEIPAVWMDQLKQSVGALLFVRIMSDQNVSPLDWVTSGRLLRLDQPEAEEEYKIPTQVSLCQLLRFLESTLVPATPDGLPRVAVVVTAWDRLDKEASQAGPTKFLEKEYPLFAGRLKDSDKLDVRVFGVSIVGGDLGVDPAFRQKFLKGNIGACGYVMTETDNGVEQVPDLTLPVEWLVRD